MKLLKSKMFWSAVIDAAAGILTLFGKTYWPEQAEMVRQIWGYLQPIALIVIGAFATDELIVPALLRTFTFKSK